MKSRSSSKKVRKKLPHKLGKAQAREQFSPLVEALATEGGIVEITDYGKTAAVLLGYRDYLSLVAQANLPHQPKRQLAGSAVLACDLEEVSKEISKSIRDSVDRTVAEL